MSYVARMDLGRSTRVYEKDSSTLDKRSQYFKICIENENYMDATKLLNVNAFTTAVRSAIADKELQGYDFLLDMPEEEAEDWMDHAIRTYCRGRRKNPTEWPVTDLLGAMDIVREHRKKKKAEAKAKKEAT